MNSKIDRIQEYKKQVEELLVYKQRFADSQEYETSYFIELNDDKNVDDKKKAYFFFNKLMTVNGELKAMRVDYEKKRQEAAELREQNDELAKESKCLKDEKIVLRTEIRDQQDRMDELNELYNKQKYRISNLNNELNKYKRSLATHDEILERSSTLQLLPGQTRNIDYQSNQGSSDQIGFQSYFSSMKKDDNAKPKDPVENLTKITAQDIGLPDPKPENHKKALNTIPNKNLMTKLLNP